MVRRSREELESPTLSGRAARCALRLGRSLRSLPRLQCLLRQRVLSSSARKGARRSVRTKPSHCSLPPVAARAVFPEVTLAHSVRSRDRRRAFRRARPRSESTRTTAGPRSSVVGGPNGRRAATAGRRREDPLATTVGGSVVTRIRADPPPRGDARSPTESEPGGSRRTTGAVSPTTTPGRSLHGVGLRKGPRSRPGETK
jgi:hypothetical protein